MRRKEEISDLHLMMFDLQSIKLFLKNRKCFHLLKRHFEYDSNKNCFKNKIKYKILFKKLKCKHKTIFLGIKFKIISIKLFTPSYKNVLKTYTYFFKEKKYKKASQTNIRFLKSFTIFKMC
jgi:hypothetical protein